MNKVFLKLVFFTTLLFGILIGCKDHSNISEKITTANDQNASDRVSSLVVDFQDTGIKIQPTMYGIFFEDINFAADGGLYAEMVKNRSFEFTLPKMGWQEPNSDRHSLNNSSGIMTIIKYNGNRTNHNYARINVKNDKGYVLINDGFRGMGVKKDANYNLSVNVAQNSGDIRKIKFQLVDSLDYVLGETVVAPKGNAWETYKSQFRVSKTEMKAKLKITFEGTGKVDLDMVSIFPEDTWKGRKNGMRKDIVQLLADLNPGFVRFPGGCIVEGRTLARRYQWKKTVGPIEDREILVNRWNTEFGHRLTPDYYQSFGIGFFEYFQLSEDLDAEPLPILSCGMACQFNTGELVPLDGLDPYVQDALDLIEFANGNATTPWGKVRADMGHPQPFHLKYIGVGNEQWGPDYMERYKIFEEVIKAKYPEIIIISGSGPFPDGDYFDYGWEELKKLNAEIVDEHYYRSPQWFKDNAARYDNYDRKGPKVFAGEYAAHPSRVEDGPNENNWEAALSEASFMTGLERNADVICMTSYAPLLANIDAYQWAPDMIWFNNLESYGTVNYYVQKLFSTNAGTNLLSITEDGNALTGQHNLYASAVKDNNTNELIIKVVNTATVQQNIEIKIEAGSVKEQGTIITLQSNDLLAINSFDSPQKIGPKTNEFQVKNSRIEVGLPVNSVNVIKVKIKNNTK